MTTPGNNNMDNKNVWAAVVLALGTVAGGVTALALHVPPASIIALLSVIAVPVSGALIYSKASTIEKQTNGNTTALMNMVDGVMEHFKTHTVPIASEPTPPVITVPPTPPGATAELPPVAAVR